MDEWEVKLHPDFLKDLDFLSRKELDIFAKKKDKIKQNPLRQKHLSGGQNCYREPINDNVRLIYYVKNKTIWLLTIGKHKEAYKKHLKMLYSLRMKLFEK